MDNYPPSHPDSPALFVVLINQSASMRERLSGTHVSKAEGVSEILNQWLNELVVRASGGNGSSDLIEVALIGYRTDSDQRSVVESAFAAGPKDRFARSMTELLDLAHIETRDSEFFDEDREGQRNLAVDTPIWVEPIAEGGTALEEVCHQAIQLVVEWLKKHPSSFPPVVAHFTDSVCAPFPLPLCFLVGSLSYVTHGKVVLLNYHLSSTSETTHLFPNNPDCLPNDLARSLFEISSEVPAVFQYKVAARQVFQPGARGLVFNANYDALRSFVELIRAFEMQTRPDLASEIVPTSWAPLTIDPREWETVVGSAPKGFLPKADRIDDEVQFTIFRPGAVEPNCWYDLLAFAHLSDRPPDAPLAEPEPIEQVKQKALQLLGGQAAQYRNVTQDSQHAVPHGSTLTFVPQIEGVEFNPPQRCFHWVESVHHEEFRLRASPSMLGTTARGKLTVFLGGIVLSEIPLAIKVQAQATSIQSSLAPVKAAAYRRIFASYSHKDSWIVRQFDQFARSMGDRYVGDWIDLRSGEVWSDALRTLIGQADVFQLFWSNNSMRSEFVRQEWEYALTLNRPDFIRLTYWESPLPEDMSAGLPPETLKRLHFQLLPVVGSSSHFLPLENGATSGHLFHTDSTAIGSSLDFGEASIDEVGLEALALGESDAESRIGEDFHLTPLGDESEEEERDVSQVIALDEISDDGVAAAAVETGVEHEDFGVGLGPYPPPLASAGNPHRRAARILEMSILAIAVLLVLGIVGFVVAIFLLNK
jgi:hypothetical protein